MLRFIKGFCLISAAVFGLAVSPAHAAGDLLVCSVAADQLHLAILTDRGLVHADARLRMVVETPGAAPWPVLSVHRRRAQSNA